MGQAALPYRGWDFRVFYTAASLPLDQLYSLHNQGRFQDELWKRWEVHPAPSLFGRPAFFAVLLKPLAGMEYGVALHLWLAGLTAAFAYAAGLAGRLYGTPWEVFVLLVAYYPVALSLRLGQDTPSSWLRCCWR